MSIVMGNDEFILYVRKNNRGIGKSNDQLGKEIWKQIRDLDNNAEKIREADCLWGKDGNFIGETSLPKTATQFRFDRNFLPEIYRFLDTL